MMESKSYEMTDKKGPNKEQVHKMYIRNGYILFRSEFEKGKQFTNFSHKLQESTKAWRKLNAEERKKYNDRAKEGRPEKKRRSYGVAFHSRCSMNQFIKLAEYVKSNAHLKAKVERLGFQDLLDVQGMKLPRDILVAIMRAYDPTINQFRIRGKTLEIEAKDMAELLGVPHSGQEVKVEASDTDETYQRLKTYKGFKTYSITKM